MITKPTSGRPDTGVALLIGLLAVGSLLAYGVVRTRAPVAAPGPLVALAPAPAAAALPPPPVAAAPPDPAALGLAAEHKSEGGAAAEGGEAKVTMVRLEPLVANLDEGDQVRYLRVSLQIEVAPEAKEHILAMLPRARHEALMYLSALRVADTQGLIGKQRIHRELQRRIADAVGGGVKRVYFDEFVVQ